MAGQGWRSLLEDREFLAVIDKPLNVTVVPGNLTKGTDPWTQRKDTCDTPPSHHSFRNRDSATFLSRYFIDCIFAEDIISSFSQTTST